MGKVYLMGVGPGDEELMTLKAVRMLRKCTAVMYDRLAGGNVLKHVNRDCKIYYCGKEPGCHYKTQDEINDMLVSLSKEGHIVGRVKGGDPYVFGRGGEEALRLLEENIEFEVIPGITSPISVLNYAGIPTTHRGISQSFHVFTAMSAAKLNIPWDAVAKLTGTLLFLMGYENLSSITKNLMDNGIAETTPCAVIMRGTTSKQKKVVATVKTIVEEAKKANLTSPCIIVVGEVVKLHEALNWYEKKPLFGKNICVTRMKEQAREISEKLLDLGAEVTEIPTIQIQNTPETLEPYIEKLPSYDCIAFSSVNGVNIFFEYLKEKQFDIRKLKATFAAVGPVTAGAILNHGIVPEIIADELVAESLFEKMKEQVKKGDKILLPRAKNARAYLVEALKDFGCEIEDVPIYNNTVGVRTGNLDGVDSILFTSPSTVINMVQMFGVEEISAKDCIAIGHITEKELMHQGIKAIVCEESTTDGMVKKLLEMRNV